MDSALEMLRGGMNQYFIFSYNLVSKPLTNNITSKDHNIHMNNILILQGKLQFSYLPVTIVMATTLGLPTSTRKRQQPPKGSYNFLP